MSSFDVRIFAIRRRAGRRAFGVRWRVAGRDRSRSFMTRALADSYRAELARAARKGAGFDPATGEPATRGPPEPVTASWYRHAVAYAEVMWPHPAPHSRASLADALAIVTAALTRPGSRRPPASTARGLVRARLQPPAPRSRGPGHRPHAGPGAAGLAAGQPAQRPASRARRPGRAGHATGRRTRSGHHDQPETGSVPRRPELRRRTRAAASQPRRQLWHPRKAAAALNPAAAASPAHVRAIPGHVARVRPEPAAFFGCLCYAALRPEEAVAPRHGDLTLPARGRGTLILTAACPRTGAAWTSTGSSYEPRRLKHRPDGAIRPVPVPAVPARLLRRHLSQFGTTPDGRLFRGTRAGMLSESSNGKPWRAARQAAPGPEPAATALARRPHDLRHAALTLWLNAASAPAEIARRAATSTRVPHDTYLHRTDTQENLVTQRIDNAHGAGSASRPPSQCATASGHPHRSRPGSCPLSVREPGPRPAHSPPPGAPAARHHAYRPWLSPASPQLRTDLPRSGREQDPARA